MKILTVVKNYLYLILVLITGAVSAQCPFNTIITPSSLTLCPFASDTLFASPGSAYQWFKNGNPVSGANQNFLVVSQMQDANSSFVVAVTISGCTEASPAVTVSGYNFPPIQITIENGADNTACDGDTLYLKVNAPFVSNIKWYNNGIQLINQSNDSLLVTAGGSFSVLAYTQQCPAYGQLSQPQMIMFSSALQPGIYEDQIEPVFTLNAGVAAASYIWYLDGEIINGADSVSIQPVANGAYSVEATYVSGCSKLSDDYIVNSIVVECPHEPTISPADLVLCPEQSDTLFTQAADSYQWFRQGILIPGATDSFLVVSNLGGSGSAFTVESTLNGCAEFSDIVLVDVFVFSPISLLQSQDPEPPLCDGESSTLNVGNPFTTNISWTRNGINIPGAISDSLIVINSGIYAVTAYTEACPDYGQTSDPLTLTFELAPVPVLVFNENDQTLSTGVVASSYNWYLDGVLLEVANSQTITVDSSGDYEVEVVYENSCSKRSIVLTVVVSGIENVIEGFRIYPNPFHDKLFVDLKEKTAFAGIYSIDGRLQMELNSPSGNTFTEVSGLSSGIYFVKINAGGKMAVVRIVKE